MHRQGADRVPTGCRQGGCGFVGSQVNEIGDGCGTMTQDQRLVTRRCGLPRAWFPPRSGLTSPAQAQHHAIQNGRRLLIPAPCRDLRFVPGFVTSQVHLDSVGGQRAWVVLLGSARAGSGSRRRCWSPHRPAYPRPGPSGSGALHVQSPFTGDRWPDTGAVGESPTAR
jgi:hypothetical protein